MLSHSAIRSLPKIFRSALLIFVIIFSAQHLHAQQFRAGYKPVRSGSLIMDKNFYLFTLFSYLPEVKRSIQQDTLLSNIRNLKIKNIKEAAGRCGEDAACHVELLAWSDNEISDIARELELLYKSNAVIRKMVADHLRKSGGFEKYKTLPDAEMLSNAWKDAALASNRIMQVYALGVPPKYPLIDSVSYDAHSIVYRKNINLLTQTMMELPAGLDIYFDPALRFSLDLLDINMRNEAERFEPLDSFNRSALAYIKQIDWSKYAYSAIVIPGAGPDIDRAAIDPWAISRLRIAADRFKKGEAPIFIVSGGFVKPFQTPFCEGQEMKRYLMSHFGIPEKNILLEPYARHTTTNIRNAARLIFRYHIPAQQPALIITDWYQTKTIQSDPFKKRCMDELGYLPFTMLEAKSAVETSFLPAETSLHIDALDPLDP